MYSTEAAGVPEASSQQSLAYTSEPVYETTEAPGHYQAGTGPTLAMPRGGRGPEKSFPPLCSLERVDCCLVTWDYTLGWEGLDTVGPSRAVLLSCGPGKACTVLQEWSRLQQGRICRPGESCLGGLCLLPSHQGEPVLQQTDSEVNLFTLQTKFQRDTRQGPDKVCAGVSSYLQQLGMGAECRSCPQPHRRWVP